MAKIKTMCGEHVEVNRGPTTKPIVLLDLTACVDSIAAMTPRQALRVADALTRAALKAQGVTP